MKRIATALVMIPLFVWVILWAPFEVFRAALVIVGALAYFEFHQLARVCTGGDAPTPAVGVLAGVALLYAPEPALALMLIAVLAMALALRSADLKDALPAAASVTLGVLYIFGAWRAATEIRLLSPHWLMLAMLLSWAGDTFAFYTGRAIGRHKLAPRVSPAKTWEGSAGSVAGAVLAGFIYAHFFIPNATLVQILVVSIAGNIAGQFGDLCESAFKRGAGVKDSGTLLPGHGGWLDRIDSSLFALPVVYACLRWL
jgi:phosphatidate cytidylyltransferase